MVDVIVRSTVLAVLALAALNALHGVAILVRLVCRLGARQPHFGLGLWLPVFTRPADIAAWLSAWRSALADPALGVVTSEVRVVVGRHVYLTLVSQGWAMAVVAIAPRLA
jgi:hypothetical protein